MTAPPGEVLARYPPSARPSSGPVALGNAGGLGGSRLWRFDSARGPLVLRRWPEAAGLASVERIHAWVRRAEGLGIVPVPLPGRDGRTVQACGGRLWELSPWRPGGPPAPEPPQEGQVRAAFAALALFHRAMGEVRPSSTSPGLASRVAEIESLLPRDLAEWRKIIARSRAGEARRLAETWLDGAARAAPRVLDAIRPLAGLNVAIQPVLRDARPEHFLFTGDRLTGLVDFGAMDFDPVSADLARLLGEWIGDRAELRSQALSAYDSVRPRSDAESALIDPFERSADLLIGSRWLRWGLIEGRTFDDPLAVVKGLRRGVGRLGRLVGPSRPGEFR